MPTAMQGNWIGETLLRVDPFTAGLHVLSSTTLSGRVSGSDAGWLTGPLIAAVVAATAMIMLGRGLALNPKDRS
jgi:predicted Na+-dependent transporter